MGADLDAMGKSRYFLGDVGAASRMKIVVNMIMGGMLACFVSTSAGPSRASISFLLRRRLTRMCVWPRQSEGISLAKSASLPLEDLLAIVDQGAMACPMFKLKVSTRHSPIEQG